MRCGATRDAVRLDQRPAQLHGGIGDRRGARLRRHERREGFRGRDERILRRIRRQGLEPRGGLGRELEHLLVLVLVLHLSVRDGLG